MSADKLSWKHLFAYLVAAAMTAALLGFGLAPADAATPAFLIWLMINRRLSDEF